MLNCCATSSIATYPWLPLSLKCELAAMLRVCGIEICYKTSGKCRICGDLRTHVTCETTAASRLHWCCIRCNAAFMYYSAADPQCFCDWAKGSIACCGDCTTEPPETAWDDDPNGRVNGRGLRRRIYGPSATLWAKLHTTSRFFSHSLHTTAKQALTPLTRMLVRFSCPTTEFWMQVNLRFFIYI
jgi:hypothetical protein